MRILLSTTRGRFVLTVRDSSEWWEEIERELSCASQKQRTSYERANGLGPMDRGRGCKLMNREIQI